ncbi:hypothetical protein LSTR_LSTR006528 [Laodelphax striatellus]|uniref:Corticotropin-releasing factor domain-containing protein n=1 Tax=Laodelphax striatellus TaxID=195883 RepID=A0A482WYJ5_LAOST|nr:hypothetical protein LSTR_LSTR006528 [Laodelphax striatellus]
MHPTTKLSPSLACLLAVSCCFLVSANELSAESAGYQLEDLGGGEQEALPPDPLLLPSRLAQRFAALRLGERWQHVLSDPKLYLLTETAAKGGEQEALPPDPLLLPSRLAQRFSALRQGERWQHDVAGGRGFDGGAGRRRLKRTNGPSLSIVNPLDVLRQRLLLEIARRRMRQSEDQVIANRQQSLREMEKSSDMDHGNHGRDEHS